ncbi:hypothetical protein Z948_1204 [Sulfitobacter donghicola DSW-25 = KCTC 12864 = JCM 14565]|nr:hypothetical protein Z948_1204 [Sulfitobacter donghicola DSW-25 = KCTC 12864 = JCM 14565]
MTEFASQAICQRALPLFLPYEAELRLGQAGGIVKQPT